MSIAARSLIPTRPKVAMEMGDKGGSKRSAEAGVAMADKAIELNGKNAEYYRVLGTLCGQIVPANPMAGIMIYGKRAKEALDKAVEMDPRSPASAFVAHGVGYYYLPTNFGGGPENAIKDFQRAIALDPKSADAYRLDVFIALRTQNPERQGVWKPWRNRWRSILTGSGQSNNWRKHPKNRTSALRRRTPFGATEVCSD